MKLLLPPPEIFILIRRILVLKGLVWVLGEKVAQFFFFGIQENTSILGKTDIEKYIILSHFLL